MRTRTLGKFALLASAALFCSATLAGPADTAPSEASIRELLDVTQSRKLIDNASGQIDHMMQTSMQQALAGKQISAAQQKILDEMRAEVLKIFSSNMQWDQLEPVFIDVYKRTFSQNEIDGMLAFYKTEAGKAVIAKMPLAMQNSIQAMQSRLSGMMPQVQQLQRETIERLKAAEQK